MIIANYTPDEIQWQHVGVIGILKPGDVQEFSDARGNHLLNKWGARGIIRVELHGDQNADREKAEKIYKNFWIRQVTTFNRQNEIRKNENRAYEGATDELQRKAQELGLELIGPWKYVPKTESAEVQALKEENKAIKEELAGVRNMIVEMVDLVKELKEKPKVPIAVNTEEIIRQFRNLNKANFSEWIFNHAIEFNDFPKEVVDNAKEKWAKLYPDEEWPLPE